MGGHASRHLVKGGAAVPHLRRAERSPPRRHRAARAAQGNASVTVELRAALEERLASLLGGEGRVERLALLAGGASMEAPAGDAQNPSGPWPLLLRRGARGRIHRD